uniref:DNA damage-regulated autophagy modulator protein 2 n=1 Tax=Plectus sambesii TaxID=2011161 RepID=A0A914WI34_9BILA
MVLHKVWLVPVASSACAVGSVVICYIIALANNHVDAFLPFISDTGTIPPESCIFGQLINFSAVFLLITVYLRHRQIVEYYGHRLEMRGQGRWRIVSTVLLCIGCLSAFGMSIVANFQETTVLVVHDIGALTAFFAGTAYCWGQVLFSYVMTPRMFELRLSHARLVLCLASTVFLLLCKSTEYANHLVVTTAEWLLAICFELFIVSFAVELRHAYAHAPKLLIKQVPQDHTDNNSKAVKVSYIAPDGSVNSLQTASDTTLTSR